MNRKMELMPAPLTYHTEETAPRIKPAEYKNILKYNKVFRYYIQKKHSIRADELEIIIFLYDEGYFSLETFNRFNAILQWNKIRLERLVDKLLVHEFTIKGRSGRPKRMFMLSDYAKDIVTEFYEISSGKRSPRTSVLNKTNEYDRVPGIHKSHLNIITKINNARLLEEQSLAYDDIIFKQRFRPQQSRLSPE